MPYVRCDTVPWKTTLLVLLSGLVFLFPKNLVSQPNDFPKYFSTQKNLAGALPSYDTSYIRKMLGKGTKIMYTKPDSALILFFHLLHASRGLQYHEGVIGSMLDIGIIYSLKGNGEQAYDILGETLKYCWQYPETGKKKIAKVYANIGSILKTLGKDKEAAIFYFKALDEQQKNPTSELDIAKTYCNIGSIFLSNNQYDKALYYISRGETVARSKKKNKVLGDILLNKGMVLCQIADKSKLPADIARARKTFLNTLDIGKKRKDCLLQYRSLMRLSMSLFSGNDVKARLQYLKQAELLLPDGEMDVKQKMYGLRLLGSSYHEAKQYKQAIEYYDRIISLENKYPMPDQRSAAYKALAESHSKLGHYEMAFKFQRLHQELNDSLNTPQTRKEINELETKYRTAEKDKEIIAKQLALKQKEVKLDKKNMWIGGVSAGAVLLAMSIIWLYRHNKHQSNMQARQILTLSQEQELIRQERKIEKLTALMEGEEKERLRIARELHDGAMVHFSSVKMNLGSIIRRMMGSTHHISELQEAITQLDNATQELRRSAHNLMPDMLLKEGLSGAVAYFCASLRKNAGVDIEFQQYGQIANIQAEYELMLYRIIQELVQNALKYAEAKHIIVQLDNTSRLFTITVEDNGKGFDKEAVKVKDGSGLNGIRSRVDALNGHMDIHSKAGIGTTIYIEFETTKLQVDNE